MQRDDIFRTAWGGNGTYEERLDAALQAHIVAVREAQKDLTAEVLPMLQRLARQYGLGMALGAVDNLRAALETWASTHAGVPQ